MYHYVHRDLPTPNNYYNLSEIDKHMRRYRSEEERDQAKQCWERLKGKGYAILTLPLGHSTDYCRSILLNT